MADLPTNKGIIKLNTASFRDREAYLVILGIVLISISPVGIFVGGTILRHLLLSLGLALLFWQAFLNMIVSRANTNTTTLLLGIIFAIETLSYFNLENSLDLRTATFRWICYGMVQIGFSLGSVNAPLAFDIPRSGGTFFFFIPLLISLSSILWLSQAASQTGPQRFAGNSEELSPVGVGYNFGVLAIVSVAFLLTEKRPAILLFHLTAMILAASAAITTGSRGPIVWLFLLSGLGALHKIRSSPLLLLRFGAVSLIVIALLAVSFSRIPFLQDQSTYLISRFDSAISGNHDAAIIARSELRQHYYSSVNEWFMFGFRNYKLDMYPHNFFLEGAVRFGVFGLLLCLIVLAVFVRGVILSRIVSRDVMGYVILLTGLYTFLVSQFSLSLEFERCLWLFVGYWSAKEANRSVYYSVA